jgi:hypothetical protein
VPKHPSPSPAAEHEDDMPVDFDPQIGEGDEYEVDEEIDDHAKQAHMESKQYVTFYFFLMKKSVEKALFWRFQLNCIYIFLQQSAAISVRICAHRCT